MPEHRPIDFTGAVLALLLSALWGANPVAIKLGLADRTGPILRSLDKLGKIGREGVMKELRAGTGEGEGIGVGLSDRQALDVN